MSAPKELTLPKLFDEFVSGTLVAWHAAPGDTVAKGEVIAEVMTDKVNVEIESPYDGTIAALLVNEDDTVEYGQAIATFQ